jgi:glycosyltransferase involved in cell wall biosynthesis
MSQEYELVPAVAVIVPAYQAAATLPATLDSALAQSVRDFELVVVDDGSSDTTAAVVSAYAREDSRVRLIKQPNAGVSAARNAGLLATRAPLVAFLDADDLWPPEHLALHTGVLARAGAQVPMLSFSVARFIDAAGRTVGHANPRLTHLDAAALLAGNPTTTTSTWVTRRSVFERVGLFDATLRRSEDQEWLVRAALSGVRIQGTAMTEVAYRTSSAGLAGDLEAMRTGFLAMLARIERLAPALVAAHGPAAQAAEARYLARQALRLCLPRAIARRYLLDALRTDPTLLLTQPYGTWGTLAAACLPGSWPLPRLRRRPRPSRFDVYEG